MFCYDGRLGDQSYVVALDELFDKYDLSHLADNNRSLINVLNQIHETMRCLAGLEEYYTADDTIDTRGLRFGDKYERNTRSMSKSIQPLEVTKLSDATLEWEKCINAHLDINNMLKRKSVCIPSSKPTRISEVTSLNDIIKNHVGDNDSDMSKKTELFKVLLDRLINHGSRLDGRRAGSISFDDTVIDQEHSLKTQQLVTQDREFKRYVNHYVEKYKEEIKQ